MQCEWLWGLFCTDCIRSLKPPCCFILMARPMYQYKVFTFIILFIIVENKRGEAHTAKLKLITL